MMVCSSCGAHGEKTKETVGNLPLNWTKVYLTVKKQKLFDTDIRTRQATMMKISPIFCEECSNKRIYSKMDAKQNLQFTVEI